jgi:Xaa-Pro aminopeptidase
VQAQGDPLVVSPYLEKSAALASPIGEMGLEILTWQETESPYKKISQSLGKLSKYAVDGRMWAEKLIHFQSEFTKSQSVSGTDVIANLRMVKDLEEIRSLQIAGLAIDQVHAQVPNFLKAGRTEREVGSDIANAILAAGHKTVDFVIVGSGPNSASPHHEVSDRIIQNGDVVVVDLGGTMPDGYCSDSTRTYAIGSANEDYLVRFEILHKAQQLATQAVRPGVSCESIDEVARKYMTEHGIGDLFIHRIGHGIGLETHEHPYMVSGNSKLIQEGFAFSIEPGFYEDGKSGARIEDIVVCGTDGAIVLNNQPRELFVV